MKLCMCLSWSVAILFALSVRPAEPKKHPDLAKKDIRDYSDADMERLLDQWEEDEEPIPPDELPEGHPDRPRPPVDFSKLDPNNPDEMMKVSKKGQTVMMFVRVNDFVSREDTEEITSLWQTGLYNSHIQSERFVLEDDRIMFLFRDGSAAWDAKDFFLDQERCEDVQLEQQTYYGKYSKKGKEEQKKKKSDKKKTSSDKKKKASKEKKQKKPLKSEL